MAVAVPVKDPLLQKKFDTRIQAEQKTQQTLLRMQKDFLGSINAYALVLVLLATVTYAGFLQPPGGINPSTGYMYNRTDTKVFIIFNSSSFYLAVADLLLCLSSSLSPLTHINTLKGDFNALPPVDYGSLQSEQITTKQLSQFVASTLFKLICVNIIFTISLVCCVAAFTAAGFVVTTDSKHPNGHLRHFSGTRIHVLVTSIVGVLFFGIFMVWLLRDSFRFATKAVRDQSLSTSLQNRAGIPQVQFRYLTADDTRAPSFGVAY